MTDETTPQLPTVLVVDDHPLFRLGLTGLLALQSWVGGVFEASSVATAVREATVRRADLVALDLRLGREDGIDAIPRILTARPQAVIVVLTTVADEAPVGRAIRAGARGYLLKTAPPEDICSGLSFAYGGGLVLGSGLDQSALTQDVLRKPLPPKFGKLTVRQLQLAQCLARGESNAHIARTLRLKDHTVRNEISQLLVRLGVSDRVGAALLAHEAGLHDANADLVDQRVASGHRPRGGA